MVDSNKKTPENIEENEETTPHLSEDFYKKLVQQPSCITDGMCDSCGGCEH